MKHKNNIFILLLTLVGSAQAISFRDYYHGNEALGIPSHEKEVDAAVEEGLLFLNDQNLTDLVGFNEVPGLHGLRRLSFSDNQFTVLPDNIFNGLVELEMLSLSKNELLGLHKNIFHGLTALRSLYLGSNQIAMLPSNIFHGLIGLEELNLSNNRLTTLQEGMFNDLNKLHTLDLSSNDLSSLPANVFHGLTALHSLSLSYNQLTVLPENIFHGLASLKEIGLSNNQLTGLPNNIFLGLNELRRVSLNNNPIPLTQAQLEKELQFPANALLIFKSRPQEEDEHDLFHAIKNADVFRVRGLIDAIMTGKTYGLPNSNIQISKIRNAHGDNLLHAAIRDASERIRIIEGMSVGLPEAEKKAVKEVQAEQKREINDRYMKIISEILSCGEECVQDMLFTTNAEGQQVIDAMIAKLGFDNPITEVMLYGRALIEPSAAQPEVRRSARELRNYEKLTGKRVKLG